MGPFSCGRVRLSHSTITAEPTNLREIAWKRRPAWRDVARGQSLQQSGFWFFSEDSDELRKRLLCSSLRCIVTMQTAQPLLHHALNRRLFCQ